MFKSVLLVAKLDTKRIMANILHMVTRQPAAILPSIKSSYIISYGSFDLMAFYEHVQASKIDRANVLAARPC